MACTFYRCEVCENLVSVIEDGGGELVCCNQPMVELVANTADASKEKHVPAIQHEGAAIKVQVGSAVHPMLKEHYIGWIALAQEGYAQIKFLQPGDAPEAVFIASAGAAVVYAWCNLHGLWMAET